MISNQLKKKSIFWYKSLCVTRGPGAPDWPVWPRDPGSPWQGKRDGKSRWTWTCNAKTSSRSFLTKFRTDYNMWTTFFIPNIMFPFQNQATTLPIMQHWLQSIYQITRSFLWHHKRLDATFSTYAVVLPKMCKHYLVCHPLSSVEGLKICRFKDLTWLILT